MHYTRTPQKDIVKLLKEGGMPVVCAAGDGRMTRDGVLHIAVRLPDNEEETYADELITLPTAAAVSAFIRAVKRHVDAKTQTLYHRELRRGIRLCGRWAQTAVKRQYALDEILAWSRA